MKKRQVKTSLFLKDFFSFKVKKKSGKKDLSFPSFTYILLFLCTWDAEHWVVTEGFIQATGNEV